MAFLPLSDLSQSRSIPRASPPGVVHDLKHCVLLLGSWVLMWSFSCSQAFASPRLCPSCPSVGCQETPSRWEWGHGWNKIKRPWLQ